MKLEDGEEVIRLRGASRGTYKSDRPHAGVWGSDRGYVLVPCRSRESVLRRTRDALKHAFSLENRSSDLEVLLLGTFAQVTALITSGPLWCRAQAKRPKMAVPHLESFKFRKRAG